MYKCTAIKVYIWTTVQWPTVQLYYFTTVQIHTCISVQVYNWTVRTQLASVKVNMCNILLQNKLQNCQQILYSQYPPNWHERMAFQRFFFVENGLFGDICGEISTILPKCLCPSVGCVTYFGRFVSFLRFLCNLK